MTDHYLKQELYELLRTDARVFEFLQAGSLDGIWYWDLESPEDEWMSPRFWEILGWDPAEREHKSAEWQDLIHPDDLPEALGEYHACLEAPGRLYDCPSVRYKRPDGSWTWVRCRGFLVRDADGKPIRMLGAHNEITELKRTEEALQRKIGELEAARDELKRSNEALAQFAYVASHDLQEPLRMVSSFADLLARRYREELDDTARGWIGYITEGSSRMSGLISGLLEWSRVHTHGGSMVHVPLNGLVGDVLQDLSVAIEDAGAEVTVAPDLPTVRADRAQLRRVFQNLVGNAIKFHRPETPPRVEIAAARAGGTWEVSVADDGIGIAPEFHGRVFEMFQRLHARGDYAGNGLGLSISKRIAERHGGDLRLESAGEGHGSTFVVVLPAS